MSKILSRLAFALWIVGAPLLVVGCSEGEKPVTAPTGGTEAAPAPPAAPGAAGETAPPPATPPAEPAPAK